MSHSPAVSEWDNDYARVARVASQLRTQGLHTGGGNPQQQLQQHLARLDSALSTLPLAPAELQRRRRLIHHLRGGSVGLSPSYSRTPNSMSSGTDGGGMTSIVQSPYQPPMSQMASAMQQQDEMIDELAVGVSRLRDQTQVIHDEARMHVNLLGEMETNLEAAHSGLDEETKRAAKLKEDQSVWRLQLILAGEGVLFIMLLFLGLSP
ncbi:hypothetical protein IV203_007965 [Nitzschia inconspicua]|uniref:t-SNARE coiled-coil homology domain-containing protein n=1 Tax=Nitzschia inconspicua TaxID=303405 RepID=A0A9K3KXT0_9STRA|nr:hypothetical protein IV203_007965 [Nitzschia inconspicua]